MDFLYDVWAEVRPQAVSGFAAALGLVIMIITGWLSLKAAATLKAVKDEKRAFSLYRTIINVLTSLVASRLAGAGGATVLTGVPISIVNDAVALVKAQNPEAVSALSQTDGMIKTKVIAKLPEVQASVAEAAAKVEAAAQ